MLVVIVIFYHQTETNRNSDKKKKIELYRMHITAIIPIYGILTKNKPGAFDDVLGMTSYERIYEQIEEAFKDRSINIIFLDVDNPGREVNGVFDLSIMLGQRKRS
jgi:ClpP class serine protease